MLMKKLWIICFMTLVGLHLTAQDIVYSTLKDLLAHKGDTVTALKIENGRRIRFRCLEGPIIKSVPMIINHCVSI